MKNSNPGLLNIMMTISFLKVGFGQTGIIVSLLLLMLVFWPKDFLIQKNLGIC